MSTTQQNDLKSALQSLHETLGETTDVTEESRELLQTVSDDIHRLIDHDEEPLKAAAERLREVIVDFEIQHPTIAHAVEQVTTALANLGI